MHHAHAKQHTSPKGTAGPRSLGHNQRGRVRQALRGVQAKLAVGQADSVHEREADRVATQVLGNDSRPEAVAVSPLPAQGGEVIQRDALEAAAFTTHQSMERLGRGPDPIAEIFDRVVASNIAMADSVSIPSAWLTAVLQYAGENLLDGVVLLAALSRLPIYYRGGWIMDMQPDAAAMTLDHSIFMPTGHSLSLKTYVHELVHVTQFGVLGTTNFLTSYFGTSAAVIAYRWATHQPLSPMRSSPHEEQAYQLADRFASWYTSAHGSNPSTVTV